MKAFLARIRFLPATIFAAALMLTVKVGGIWSGLEGLVDDVVKVSAAKAQTQEPAQPATPDAAKGAPTQLAPAGERPGAAPGQTGTPPAPQAGAKPAADPATPAPGAKPSQPGAAPAQAQAPKAPAPAAPTAAPGAGQAAKPTDSAKKAAESAEAVAARVFASDPTLLTQAEIDLLQKLAARREVLDARERELESRLGFLRAAETRIDKKVEELKGLQATITRLLKAYDDQQKAKVDSLVKIYETMKPKEAARIFEQLDMDTLLLVAERMGERKLAPIMSKMNPDKAREVTVELARARELPAAPGS